MKLKITNFKIWEFSSPKRTTSDVKQNYKKHGRFTT